MNNKEKKCWFEFEFNIWNALRWLWIALVLGSLIVSVWAKEWASSYWISMVLFQVFSPWEKEVKGE